jgi:Family of unknown function (DUF5691)
MWSEIVTAAVIGSERQEIKIPKTSDSLSELVARLDNNDRERVLLGAAAAAALYLRAGRLPVKDHRSLPEACPHDDVPRCNPGAGERLKLMLRGQYQELLPEWLACVAAARQRVQEELLPSVLDLWTARFELSEAILAVLGNRGKWLAAQSAEWRAIFGFADGSVWEDGSIDQRRIYLENLRRRDPAGARELVATAWEQESPKNRADLLQTLAQGLSPDDEPLLERALDDKWSMVRRTAADLLSRLPESALVDRMRERAMRHIAFKDRARGRLEIEIALPEVRGEEMIRDGIVKVPPHSQIGERAWWLQQMLTAVPPSFWLQRSQRTINELLKAGKKSEWSQLLLNGWSRAAVGFGDVEWIESLLDISSDHLPAEGLFGGLPPERQELIVGQLLNKASSWSSIDQLYWCFKSCRHQWSERFSLEVVRGLSKHHEIYAMRNDIVTRNILTMCVCHIHPAVIPEAINQMNSAAEQLSNRASLLDHFLDMIQFRCRMHEEIIEQQPKSMDI